MSDGSPGRGPRGSVGLFGFSVLEKSALLAALVKLGFKYTHNISKLTTHVCVADSTSLHPYQQYLASLHHCNILSESELLALLSASSAALSARQTSLPPTLLPPSSPSSLQLLPTPPPNYGTIINSKPQFDFASASPVFAARRASQGSLPLSARSFQRLNGSGDELREFQSPSDGASDDKSRSSTAESAESDFSPTSPVSPPALLHDFVGPSSRGNKYLNSIISYISPDSQHMDGGVRKAGPEASAGLPAANGHRPSSIRDLSALPSELDYVEDKYVRMQALGEGTYSTVHLAKNIETGEVVAIKRTRESPNEGVGVTTLREVRILLKCSECRSIVGLKDICFSSSTTNANAIFMVLEYLKYDMGQIMQRLLHPFSIGKVKCIVKQLLEAVVFLHSKNIMHRDLKMSNMLVSETGKLKLADFGLSREENSPRGIYTPTVVTLWYRAPEVLLGNRRYTKAIDMWSVGILFGELIKHRPLLPGRTEIDQLGKTFDIFGTPTEENWPGVSELPAMGLMKLPPKAWDSVACRALFPRDRMSDMAYDFFLSLTHLDPTKRLTAEQALAHPYFSESPKPVPSGNLLRGLHFKPQAKQ